MLRPTKVAVRRQRMIVGCACLSIAALLLISQAFRYNTDPTDALIRQLHSPDAATRSLVVLAIRQRGEVPPDLVGPLLQALHHRQKETRLAAAEILAELGPAGQPHLSELAERYLNERDREVQGAIGQAMDAINQPQVVSK